MENMANKIEICEECGRPEYWGEFRWLNGQCSCRSCYKSQYERENNKTYRWDDLDGPRPTMKDYYDQEDSK